MPNSLDCAMAREKIKIEYSTKSLESSWLDWKDQWLQFSKALFI